MGYFYHKEFFFDKLNVITNVLLFDYYNFAAQKEPTL